MKTPRTTDHGHRREAGAARPLTVLGLAAMLAIGLFALAGCTPAGRISGRGEEQRRRRGAGHDRHRLRERRRDRRGNHHHRRHGRVQAGAEPGRLPHLLHRPGAPVRESWFDTASSWSSATPLDISSGPATADDTALTPSEQAAILGTVTDQPTALPLAGIHVRLIRAASGSTAATATTDAAGSYLFGGLVPATGYKLVFSDPTSAHATVYSSNADTLGSAATLTPGTGESLTADQSLSAPGAITGTVNDGRGALGGIAVVVLRPHTTDVVTATTTDGAGHYALSGLAPGAYTVEFADPLLNHATHSGHVPAYHGQTVANLATAPNVLVAAGATTSGIGGTMAGADCDPLVFHPGADLSGADLSGEQLSGCDLRGIAVDGANLGHADLAGADLAALDLTSGDLSGTDLSHTNLSGATLFATNLTGANLTSADLTSTIYLEYATGLTSTTMVGTDFGGTAALAGADLHGKDLSGTVFTGASLNNTNFTGATLTGTVFTSADLGGATFTGAIGINTTLIGTDQAAGPPRPTSPAWTSPAAASPGPATTSAARTCPPPTCRAPTCPTPTCPGRPCSPRT